MGSIIATQLFTFIIFLNYDKLWASGNDAHSAANNLERRGPPPEARLFAGHPNAELVYVDGQYMGAILDGNYVPNATGVPRPHTGGVSTQESSSHQEQRVEPKEPDFLPDAAEVFRPPKGRIGFLFDKRINGPDEKGEVRVLAAHNGDLIISKGKPIAKYNNGWKEFKVHQ